MKNKSPPKSNGIEARNSENDIDRECRAHSLKHTHLFKAC
jgi:hypothetical protein